MDELKYPITPENAHRFAELAVSAVKEHEGATLDYSVRSLKVVDRIIGRFHKEGATVEDVEITLFQFGCYVGEVFVRNAGGKWRRATRDEKKNVFGVPLVLQLDADTTANPIGKVKKRLENGDEDNLPYFYRVFTGQKEKPWWRFW